MIWGLVDANMMWKRTCPRKEALSSNLYYLHSLGFQITTAGVYITGHLTRIYKPKLISQTNRQKV